MKEACRHFQAHPCLEERGSLRLPKTSWDAFHLPKNQTEAAWLGYDGSLFECVLGHTP